MYSRTTPAAAPAPAAALTSEAEKDAGGDNAWVPPARHGLDNRCVRVCVGMSRVLCVCVARRVAQGAIRFRWLCRGAFASQRPRDRASSSLDSIQFYSIAFGSQQRPPDRSHTGSTLFPTRRVVVLPHRAASPQLPLLNALTQLGPLIGSRSVPLVGHERQHSQVINVNVIPKFNIT